MSVDRLVRKQFKSVRICCSIAFHSSRKEERKAVRPCSWHALISNAVLRKCFSNVMMANNICLLHVVLTIPTLVITCVPILDSSSIYVLFLFACTFGLLHLEQLRSYFWVFECLIEFLLKNADLILILSESLLLVHAESVLNHLHLGCNEL